jgi:hypothetical protein
MDSEPLTAHANTFDETPQLPVTPAGELSRQTVILSVAGRFIDHPVLDHFVNRLPQIRSPSPLSAHFHIRDYGVSAGQHVEGGAIVGQPIMKAVNSGAVDDKSGQFRGSQWTIWPIIPAQKVLNTHLDPTNHAAPSKGRVAPVQSADSFGCHWGR